MIASAMCTLLDLSLYLVIIRCLFIYHKMSGVFWETQTAVNAQNFHLFCRLYRRKRKRPLILHTSYYTIFQQALGDSRKN